MKKLAETRLALLALLATVACTDANTPIDFGQTLQTCEDRTGLLSYHLVFSGAEFEALEGARVHVKTTMFMAFDASDSCTAAGITEVVDGTFSITVQNHSDGAAYPFVGVFFDLGHDGTCDPGVDTSWATIATVNPQGEAPIALDPSRIERGAEEECYGFLTEFAP